MVPTAATTAVATTAVNDVGPTVKGLLVPPAVVTVTVPSAPAGMMTLSLLPLEDMSIVPLLVSGSTTDTAPKFTVVAPSMKPPPLSVRVREVPEGRKSLMVKEVILGTT